MSNIAGYGLTNLASMFFGRTADTLREGGEAVYGTVSGSKDIGTPVDFFVSLALGGLVNDDKTSMGQAGSMLRGFASMVPAFRPIVMATAIPEAAMEAWRGDWMDAISSLVGVFGAKGLTKGAQVTKEIAATAHTHGIKAAAVQAGTELGQVAPKYHDAYRGFVDAFKSSFATGKTALGAV